MTIDLNTATAEELVEYLAKAKWDWLTKLDKQRLTENLNLIAAAMPPGWDWSRQYGEWIAWLKSGFGTTEHESERSSVTVRCDDTDNEHLDRLRLAALAWQAESKENEK